MKRNHIAKHDEEVEKEQSFSYKWKLQINGENPVEVTNDKLIKFLSGNNASVSVNEDGDIVFEAQVKLFKKPNKYVDDPTYVIVDGDAEKWLVFRTDCNVTVPKNLSEDFIFEGEADPGVTATFVEANETNLRHADSISKTLSQNSPFGIRVRSANNYLLYGTDPVNYAG